MDFDTVNLLPLNPNYNTLSGFTPSNYVRYAITTLFGLAGVIAFIYLLLGGLAWIASASDKEGLEKAKKKITLALTGLAVVFSAYALVFIVQVLFNIPILGFRLGPLGTSSSPSSGGTPVPTLPPHPTLPPTPTGPI